MKKTALLILLLISHVVYGNILDSNPVQSVLKVTTFRKDGSVIGQGNGFLVVNNNTGIAAYTMFKGAAKAEVTDCKGNKYNVTRILGASSSYDIVKFQLEEVKKATALKYASNGANGGEPVQVANYSTDKKQTATAAKIESYDDYGNYRYYYVNALNTEKNFGCPVVNASGEVVAIIQKNLAKDTKKACAIDVRFAADLGISSTSSLNADLQAIDIPKALPQDENDALTYIYMMNASDSASTRTALDDFICAYPENAEGYVNRAVFHANHSNYSESEQDFATALSKVEHGKSTITADAIHYNFSKILFSSAVSIKTPKPEGWSLQRALSEAIAAQDYSPNPLYLLQRGECEYALSDFKAAVKSFREVCRTELASPQTFYKTAQAMEKAEMPRTEILEQLDSAVARLSRPYKASEAYYLYIRANQEIALGKYRQAAIDLTDYEQAVGAGSLTHTFFAERAQTERRAKMFQQALDDIRLAQTKAVAPQIYFYQLEEASILLQVGMFDDAISKATQILHELPESPDCYKIIGIAYGEKQQREEALRNLNKAKQLGDENIDTLIEKYSK